MQEKELIGSDEAQRIAERFLRGQIQEIRSLTIEKTKLNQIGEILVYDVEGIAKISKGFLASSERKLFKVQVLAKDGTIVGCRWGHHPPCYKPPYLS